MKLQVVKYDELLEAFAWTVECSLFLARPRSAPTWVGWVEGRSFGLVAPAFQLS